MKKVPFVTSLVFWESIAGSGDYERFGRSLKVEIREKISPRHRG